MARQNRKKVIVVVFSVFIVMNFVIGFAIASENIKLTLLDTSSYSGDNGAGVAGDNEFIYGIGPSGNSFEVKNVTNKSNIQTEGTITDASNFSTGYGIDSAGDNFVVHAEASGPWNIIDVSNKSNPQIIYHNATSITLDGNLEVEGDYLYLVDLGNNKVIQMDISDKNSPTDETSFGNSAFSGGNIRFIEAIKTNDSRKYLLLYGYTSSDKIIAVYNITNPSSITQTHVANLGSHGSFTQYPLAGVTGENGNYSYVSYNNAIKTINHTDKTNFIVEDSVSTTQETDLFGGGAVEKDNLYLQNDTHLLAYDISGVNKTNPELKDQVSLNIAYAHTADSKYLYVGTSSSIQVYDTNTTIGPQPEPPEQNLSLIIKPHMDYDSSQEYAVLFNDDGNIKDVSKNANISSSNISVITVDNATDTLISTSNVSINQRVIITAKYSGFQTQENVTVANRSLSNIDIMPPEAWIPSLLGVDSKRHGIGTEIQWLYLVILTMAVITYNSKNAWLGIGTGVISLVLLWALDNVSLGIVLASVFFGIFIGLAVMKTGNNGQKEFS